MNERLVHLHDCTPERVWALRWHLFAFPEVRNVMHHAGDVVRSYAIRNRTRANCLP
jgi:hypothetical protein